MERPNREQEKYLEVFPDGVNAVIDPGHLPAPADDPLMVYLHYEDAKRMIFHIPFDVELPQVTYGSPILNLYEDVILTITRGESYKVLELKKKQV